MSPSGNSQLEPRTWRRFVLFLLILVGMLLCFSLMLPAPEPGTFDRRQASD